MKLKILSIFAIPIFMLTLFGAADAGNAKTISAGSAKFIKTPVQQDTIHLISKNLFDDFVFVMRDKDVNPETIVTDKSGELFFNTNQVGYFRTKKSLTNYKLHCEWKWPDKSVNGNSGVLVYMQAPDSVWPKCIQEQLKQKRAGDLIAMNGAMFDEAIGKPKDTAEMLAGSNEKENDEWNSCDIICTSDSMTVFINGLLQNKATGIKIPDGGIGFQLEGKPVYFRNLYVVQQ